MASRAERAPPLSRTRSSASHTALHSLARSASAASRTRPLHGLARSASAPFDHECPCDGLVRGASAASITHTFARPRAQRECPFAHTCPCTASRVARVPPQSRTPLHSLARSASAASITHTLTAVVTHDRPHTGPTLPRSRTCKGERYSTDPPASFAEDDARACRLVSTVHVTASRAVRAPPPTTHVLAGPLAQRELPLCHARPLPGTASRAARAPPLVMHDPCPAWSRAQRELRLSCTASRATRAPPSFCAASGLYTRAVRSTSPASNAGASAARACSER